MNLGNHKSQLSYLFFRNLFNNYFTSNLHLKIQRGLLSTWDDILSDKHICEHEIMRSLLGNQIPSRAILLGSPGSGKSTFTRSSNSKTESGSSFEGHTDGIEISSLGNISFWEFGGQEVLFSTHQFFMSENTQYLLFVNLFALVNDDKFKNNQCEILTEYWMKEIKIFTKNNERHCPPVIFIGTHCDLFGNKESGIHMKQLAIDKLLQLSKITNLHSHKHVHELAFAKKNRTKYTTIRKILQQIRTHTAKYIRKDQGLSQSGDCSFAIQYLMAKYKIEKEKERKPFMWWNEFEKEIFHSENIHSEECILQVSKSLKNSGVIETHRFHSSGASDLVILDPIFLTGAFGSIITLNSSRDNKRGYFTFDEIEKNFHSNNIENKNMKKELLLIFEMFHLIIKLPSGEYYVPGMIHSQSDHIDNVKHEIQSKIQRISRNQSFRYIGRKYIFSPRISFGFIERLIVRILHFPGMEIHPISTVNNFYVFSEEDGNYNNRNYHIFIQLDDEEENINENHLSTLKISIYYPREEENHFYSLFVFHVIFQSPHEVLHSFIHSNSSIDQTILLNNQHQEIGTESDLLMNFNACKHYRQYICGNDIQVLESDLFHFKFIKYLNQINNNFVWIGTMRELGKEHEKEVIFKEPISITFENLKSMLNEIILLEMMENEFTLKLIGICFPTDELWTCRMKLESLSNKMIEFTSKEEYLNHQMLMIVEKSPFGSLADCFAQINKCSISLKFKIAFDIARGMNILFLKSGMKIIHRNINPENIFIFSMDEYSTNSIHAKLGDLGRCVIGIPFYFQSLDDDDFKYTAPEALGGSSIVPYSQSIDVYSFGILLWQLLSGKIPFYDLKNDIKNQIISGHRPSVSDLPYDFAEEHEEIIELIQACWDTNPRERPSFGEIISILYPNIHDWINTSKQKYIKYISQTFEIKQKIIGKKLDASMFSIIEFKGEGCYGLVMICNLTLEGKECKVALKMLRNYETENLSGTKHRKTINEYNFLSDDIQHPNIICKYESFISIPTDEMIQHINESTRDLCFDENNELKKHQFYILQAYEITLESVIDRLPLDQIMKFSYQLSSALLFLFTKNIVHLDIKPDNLMISSNGDLVIVDFGVAGHMDNSGFVLIQQTTGGNEYHLAPEVFQARTENKNLPCSLQYSWELGMIIFEMFNKGIVPFEPYEHNIFLSSPVLDLSNIPFQLQYFVSKLLCPVEERLSIEEAHEILLEHTNFRKLEENILDLL